MKLAWKKTRKNSYFQPKTTLNGGQKQLKMRTGQRSRICAINRLIRI